MYVYVLNEDSIGETNLLFPLADLDLQNPLSSDVAHRLPGPIDRLDNYWRVSSAGGRETIFVIVSRERLSEFEDELERFPRAGSDVSVELDDAAVGIVLRGIGDLSPLPSAGNQAHSLSALFEHLPDQHSRAKDVWLLSIPLDNPVPE
jgi:hypothetical protein